MLKKSETPALCLQLWNFCINFALHLQLKLSKLIYV